MSTDRRALLPLEVRRAAAAASKKKYPEKRRARNAVYEAVRSGRLVRPEACERCGAIDRVEASHDDYAKRLDVEWLCRTCHVRKDAPTHCAHDHEFTPENTLLVKRPDGTHRACRQCKRERDARRVRPSVRRNPGCDCPSGRCSACRAAGNGVTPPADGDPS